MPRKCTEFHHRTAHNRWMAVRWTPGGLQTKVVGGDWEDPAPDQHGIARAQEYCPGNLAASKKATIGCDCPHVEVRTRPPGWPDAA